MTTMKVYVYNAPGQLPGTKLIRNVVSVYRQAEWIEIECKVNGVTEIYTLDLDTAFNVLVDCD